MMSEVDLSEVLRTLTRRIHTIEVRESGPTTSATVANLPTPGTAGRLRFVTNGRKVGEGVGAGTGTLAYDDGVAWRRVGDDTTVLA
jgi:hypothetical protein